MRRKGHPSFPSAMTCCFFASLKTLLIPTEAIAPLAGVNVLALSLAGFQVTLIGRFWVIPEDCLQTSNRPGGRLCATRSTNHSGVDVIKGVFQLVHRSRMAAGLMWVQGAVLDSPLQQLAQSCAGFVHLRFRIPGCASENPGNLVVVVSLHVVQNEHPFVSGRQFVD